MMKFNVKGQSEGLKLTATAGDHELVLDEGSQMGGKNEGPNPLQTSLAALASCENVTANMVAKEMGFDLQSIHFDVEGEFNPKGFMGQEGVRPYFQTVTVNAVVETSESEERLKELQEKVEARCPVYTMMKAADVTMQDTWTKK
ncbi:putative OsmC-like protein [Salsuginibacillus halophilus]|uniref:Putative OsmC-like protein n=1 Tax=Salsuginibacillus halophilus TaxID=517424 RepID=A0A2P8HDZ4_9BACI|nr:OsmC family protein [Salsuginibacillus halophilus]PSL44447.1 putative OsmC-like protein [Salsuginibacillus halophilus]